MTIRQIPLPYGSQVLEIGVPDENLAVASPMAAEIVGDAEELIRQALRKPVGTSHVSTMLRQGQRLLLLVDDLTRPTPVDRILPILLDELDVERKGIEVTILIALGTHRKMTETEIEAKVGSEITRRWPVVNHDCEDPATLVDLGTTSNGTPIMVNRLIVEADICLGISNVVPHNLAGWSGGAKIVQPGICGKTTTYRTHLLAARCPTTNYGKLMNPLRAEIEHVVQKTKLTAMVNTVLDRHGTIVHIVAGDMVKSHRQAVELARPIWEVNLPRLADIVIVSSHPADIDFWQANKGLYAAERCVKRGGDIILLTPCPEGLSSQKEHVSAMEALRGIPSRGLFQEARSRGLEDYAALCVSDIAARSLELAWVTVVSDGLSETDIAILGFDRAPNFEAALERALRRQGDHASIVVITHGGETLPVVGREA